MGIQTGAIIELDLIKDTGRIHYRDVNTNDIYETFQLIKVQVDLRAKLAVGKLVEFSAFLGFQILAVMDMPK